MKRTLNRFFISIVGFAIAFSAVTVVAQNKKIDSLKKVVKIGKQDTASVAALNMLSVEILNTEDLETSLVYSQRALEVASAINFKRGQAYALKNMGLAKYYEGDFVSVLDYWTQSLKIFEAIGDKTGIANLTNNLGAVYYSQGNMVKALEYYLQSLSIAEKIGDPMRLSSVLPNIGSIYGRLGKYDKALEYNKRLEPYLVKINDPKITSSYLMNIGEIYSKKKDFNKAKDYYEQALPLTRKTTDLAHNLAMLGRIEYKRGNTQRAVAYLDSAYNTASELKLQPDKIQTLLALGEIYKQKDSDAALAKYTEAEQLALEANTQEELRDIYKGKAEAFANINDYENAFKYQTLFISQKDTLFNLEIDDKMRGLQFDFDLQQKEDEIDLLEAEAQLTELKSKRQRYIIYGSIILLVLLIVLALGTYSRYRYVKKTSRIINKEKNRSDKLLKNILPEETAMELKKNGRVKAKKFDSVSVMFTDFRGFTIHSQDLSPEVLVKTVDYYFSKFDRIIEKYGLEKIKTIGDAYMCAGGLPYPSEDHTVRMVEAAFEITRFMEESKHNTDGIMSFDIRVGINTGPVVAGVVGLKKFAYDIWGDTVNVASRMESMSLPGKINVSENTYLLIRDSFECEKRGEVLVKNKGKMKMYFVKGKISKDSDNQQVQSAFGA